MPSAYSVPMASEVLPDPDTPTTATVRHNGTSTSMSCRLLCRAPRTPMTVGRVPGTGMSPAGWPAGGTGCLCVGSVSLGIGVFAFTGDYPAICGDSCQPGAGTIHDFGVAVEIPLEQRTDIVAGVRDKSVDGRHRMYYPSAHALIMPAQPPDALRCALSRRGRSDRRSLGDAYPGRLLTPAQTAPSRPLSQPICAVASEEIADPGSRADALGDVSAEPVRQVG
jgi:hypothetical protein